MKLLLLVFLVCVWCGPYEQADAMITYINGGNFGWQAEHNKFSYFTFEQKKAMCGVNLAARHRHMKHVKKQYPVADEPNDSFDSRTEWPKCTTIGNIMDQGHCGSCWAFGGTESLTDRFCTQNGQSTAVPQLSPQDLVSCDTTDLACNGGYLDNEWKWMVSHGVCTLQCMKYVSGDGHVPPCPSKCDDESEIVRYKCDQYSHVSGGVSGIAADMKANGPQEVAFSVYEDFMNYKSGVYKHTTGRLLGGHAVKAIGFGTSGSEDYWIIANSWATTWGMQGYFWILKGHNECGIESNVYCCAKTTPPQ